MWHKRHCRLSVHRHGWNADERGLLEQRSINSKPGIHRYCSFCIRLDNSTSGMCGHHRCGTQAQQAHWKLPLCCSSCIYVCHGCKVAKLKKECHIGAAKAGHAVMHVVTDTKTCLCLVQGTWLLQSYNELCRLLAKTRQWTWNCSGGRQPRLPWMKMHQPLAYQLREKFQQRIQVSSAAWLPS